MKGDVKTVVVRTMSHQSQRYDTVGDWLIRGRRLLVNTSDLGDWRQSMCCAVHEIIEALLCHNDGVKESDVSAFDVAYEKARQAHTAAPCGCVPTEDSEPGEDVHAPYRAQHAFADGIERLLANQLGVNWDDYSAAVAELHYEEKPHAASQTA